MQNFDSLKQHWRQTFKKWTEVSTNSFIQVLLIIDENSVWTSVLCTQLLGWRHLHPRTNFYFHDKMTPIEYEKNIGRLSFLNICRQKDFWFNFLTLGWICSVIITTSSLSVTKTLQIWIRKQVNLWNNYVLSEVHGHTIIKEVSENKYLKRD